MLQDWPVWPWNTVPNTKHDISAGPLDYQQSSLLGEMVCFGCMKTRRKAARDCGLNWSVNTDIDTNLSSWRWFRFISGDTLVRWGRNLTWKRHICRIDSSELMMLQSELIWNQTYPLVNVYITMERSTIFPWEHSLFLWWFLYESWWFLSMIRKDWVDGFFGWNYPPNSKHSKPWV